MSNNLLILAEDDLGQLPELNLQMYPQVIVTTSSQNDTLSIVTAKTLLALQLKHNINVQLIVNAAKNPIQPIYLSWLLGQLAINAPETQITLLTSDHALQPLVEICAEYGQSLRLLQVNTAAQDLSEKKPVKSAEAPPMAVASLLVNAVDEPVPELENTTAPIAAVEIAQPVAVQHEQTIQAEPQELKAPAVITAMPVAMDAGFTDIHAIQPTEKRSEIAEMIREKEERQRKNEQIINALMKKVSAVPYKIVESKPIAGMLEEQVVNPLEINKSWWVNA